MPGARRALLLTDHEEMLMSWIPTECTLPTAEQRTRELVARETVCCSLLTVTLIPGEELLGLDIEVPAARMAVLDGLADRAACSARLQSTGSGLHR
ncbi:MAG: hypothetical protein ACRDT0_24045 [Pseudonocardiaceae bacterium]